MPRIHIVHVITKLELGGAQQNTLYTVRHLDRSRFQPHLITGPGGILQADAQKLNDVPYTVLPKLRRAISPLQDAQGLLQLRQALRRIPRPFIVHTHCSKAGILGRIAARAAFADATIHSVHGFAFHPLQARPRRYSYIAAEFAAGPLADAYICVSRADKKLGQRLRLFGRARIALIRSGIEFADFRFSQAARDRIRSQLGLASDTPVVGTIANLKPQKAPLDFVSTAAQVLKKAPHIHFVFVGDGPLRPQVEQFIQTHNIAHRVHLVGWQSDVSSYLSAMDVFLLTSYHEGLPRSVLQARVSGNTVVATRTSGVDEVVEPALIAELGDVQGLASLVLKAIGEQRQRSETAPIPSWLEPFAADTMVRDQEQLYGSLLRQG